MSERAVSDQNYGSSRSAVNTDRVPPGSEQGAPVHLSQTERQLHEDSPTRHDIEFYVRKVNRYEAEIARLEHDLSVSKFKLSKAEDYESKYELLFKENQNTITDYYEARDQLEKTRRELDRVKIQQGQSLEVIKTLQSDIKTSKIANENLHKTKEELRTKTTSQGQEEKESLKESYNRQIEHIKQHNRDIQDKLNKEISELKNKINMKETIEHSLASKLEHIKTEKNNQINRLKELTIELRNDLGTIQKDNDEKARKQRAQLISQTEDRISNVRRLGQLIQQTLVAEIENLNDTLKKKNDQINFLTECDRKQLQNHERSEHAFRELVAKLENKIFTIQRQNQLELYDTIARLKAQYQENFTQASSEWQAIKVTHANLVENLRNQIKEQKSEIELLNSQNRNLQTQHKKLAEDKQHSLNMLSQKILSMEMEKDQDLRNYTTSMKQIEDEAKNKLDDLHAAIQNKNNQSQILQAQIDLKNGEITHLLEELSRVREVNREKLKKLETTNLNQQNALNNQLSAFKKQVFQLKRSLHELENKYTDDEAEHKLECELLKQELQSQKEANALLSEKNSFLATENASLEQRLKAERVANVNILHDHNMSKRDNVQVRQDIKVEVQALKNKEVEQLRQVHKLEKTRLQADLLKRDHELRDKKQQLGRLLVQYKALEAKVGKPSKVDRGAEEEGKCRATLEAEILLTQNIFNAINKA